LVEPAGCHSVEGIQDFGGACEEDGEQRVLSVGEDGDEDEQVPEVPDDVGNEQEDVLRFHPSNLKMYNLRFNELRTFGNFIISMLLF
jgi:hypothetical protein